MWITDVSNSFSLLSNIKNIDLPKLLLILLTSEKYLSVIIEYSSFSLGCVSITCIINHFASIESEKVDPSTVTEERIALT